jgi:hypothetical protein
VAPCARPPGWKGESADESKKNTRLACEGRNVEPGDGKGGAKARARADARLGRRECCEKRAGGKMLIRWCNILSINSSPTMGPASGHMLNFHSLRWAGRRPPLRGKEGTANHPCGTWPSKVETAKPCPPGAVNKNRRQLGVPELPPWLLHLGMGPRPVVTVTSQLRHSYVTVTSQLRHSYVMRKPT